MKIKMNSFGSTLAKTSASVNQYKPTHHDQKHLISQMGKHCSSRAFENNKNLAIHNVKKRRQHSDFKQIRHPKAASNNSFTKKLVTTVMFTDIVKSTQLVFEIGDLQWMKLLQSHYAVVRKNLETYSGTELQTNGDGFLMCFNNPLQAVDCARHIQKDMHKIKLPIRIGIHTGEVLLLDQSNIFGLTVHIASRVTAIANADQIVVSRKVKDEAKSSNNVFNYLGFFELRGLPAAWRLFSIV